MQPLKPSDIHIFKKDRNLFIITPLFICIHYDYKNNLLPLSDNIIGYEPRESYDHKKENDIYVYFKNEYLIFTKILIYG